MIACWLQLHGLRDFHDFFYTSKVQRYLQHFKVQASSELALPIHCYKMHNSIYQYDFLFLKYLGAYFKILQYLHCQAMTLVDSEVTSYSNGHLIQIVLYLRVISLYNQFYFELVLKLASSAHSLNFHQMLCHLIDLDTFKISIIFKDKYLFVEAVQWCNYSFDKCFRRFGFYHQYSITFTYILYLFFQEEELFRIFICTINFQFHFSILEYFLAYCFNHITFFSTI